MFSAVFISFAALSSNFFLLVVAAQRSCVSSVWSLSPAVPPCPRSWHHWGSSCYLVTESQVAWSSARDECAKLGGILAVPHSPEEDGFIASLIPPKTGAWISCSDLVTEGIWECKEGDVEVSYRNWDEGLHQPSGGNAENCAVISTWYGPPFKWHDYSCTRNTEHAVCKQPAVTKPLLHL